MNDRPGGKKTLGHIDGTGMQQGIKREWAHARSKHNGATVNNDHVERSEKKRRGAGLADWSSLPARSRGRKRTRRLARACACIAC
jgi:hypothetical protein